jgi:hypothetical protein
MQKRQTNWRNRYHRACNVRIFKNKRKERMKRNTTSKWW